MSERLKIFVHSDDPILQAGVTAQFRGSPSVSVTDDLDEAAVAIVAADRIDEAMARTCRSLVQAGHVRVVIIASDVDEAELLAGVEAGASGFLRRGDARADRLTSVVHAVANGEGSVPTDLIGPLLDQMSKMRGQVHARGITLPGFTERELEVLRLVAEGHETAEIARKLCYSERTVKGVIHEITSRFQLKNRAQAVAYAVRQGVI